MFAHLSSSLSSLLLLLFAVQKQDVVVLGKPNPIGHLFHTMVVVAFTCKLLHVVNIVINIITVNAFFIDWEPVLLLLLLFIC